MENKVEMEKNMIQYCSKCGNKLMDDDLFCNNCGEKKEEVISKAIVKPTEKKVESTLVSESKKAVKMLENTLLANEETGEIGYVQSFASAKSQILEQINPVKVLIQSIMSMFRNIRNLLKQKKKLTFVGALSLIWMILTLLPALNIKSKIISMASWLTFSQGGIGNSSFEVLMGSFGKGLVAYFIMSLFQKKAVGKDKIRSILLSALKIQNISDIGYLCMGLGMAMIGYNAIGGNAALSKSMAGVAALGLTLSSFRNENGFLSVFIGSFFTRSKAGIPLQKINRIKAGMTFGFVVGIGLGCTRIPYINYYVGAILIVFGVGFLLTNILKKRKGSLAVWMILIIMMGTVCPYVVAFAVSPGSAYGPKYDYSKYDYSVSSSGPSWFESEENAAGQATEGKDTNWIIVTRTKKNDTSYDSVVDTIDFNMSRIPSPAKKVFKKETVAIYTDGSEKFEATLTAKAKIDYILNSTSLDSSYTKEYTDWDSFVKYKTQNMSSGFKEITFMNRPALQLDYNWSMEIFVYFEDISLPNDNIVVLPLYIGVDPLNLNPYSGLSWEVVASTKEGAAYLDRIYQMVPDKIKEGKAQLENIKIDIRINDDETGESSVINTEADDMWGETSTDVPSAVVVGVLGTIAAGMAGAAGTAGASAGAAVGSLAGSGAGATSASDRSKLEKDASTFKMYIYKEFSNKIRFNQSELPIYARIAQIDEEGVEHSRPDLSQNIDIFSGGNITVEGNSFEGNYSGAFISAQTASMTDAPKTGTVSFSYQGEGGSFQNNVVFQLIGESYLKSSEGEELKMIFGDNGTYAMEVTVHDYLGKITNFKVESKDGIPFELSTKQLAPDRYLVKVKNNTPKEKSQKGYKTYRIKLMAEDTLGDKKEWISEDYPLTCYPEGLSVRNIKLDDKNYALVPCYADVEKPESKKVLPVSFVVDLMTSITDAEGISKVESAEPKDFELEFMSLKGTEPITDVIAQRYKIPVKSFGVEKTGTYRFEPEEVLSELRDSFYYLLQPMKTTWKGQVFEYDMEIHLIGEKLNPMAGWDKEYSDFKKYVKNFGISDDIALKIRELNKDRSTAELRLINKMILAEAKDYFTNESSEYTKIGDSLQTIETGLGVIKWFGDQAFSYLMTLYTGPMGEAILSPAKDLFVYMIGEASSAFIAGESIDISSLEFYKNIGNSIEKCLVTLLPKPNTVLSPKELKMVGSVIAAFLMVSFIKHYNSDTNSKGKLKRSVYDSLLNAFQDLTVRAVKILSAEYFSRFLDSERGKKLLDTCVIKWFKEKFPDYQLDFTKKDGSGDQAWARSFDIARKYVQEFFGLGAAKLYKAAKDVSADDIIDGTWFVIQIGVDVFLAINPLKGMEKILELIMDPLYRNFPFGSKKISPPQDPPYMKAGNIKA